MIGVKFTRAMRPYGSGDTALLPDDAAKRMIDEGAAMGYVFPSNPHASGPVEQPVPEPNTPARVQSYRTKSAR